MENQSLQTNPPVSSLPLIKRKGLVWMMLAVLGMILIFIAYFVGISIGKQNSTISLSQVSLSQPTLTKKINKSFTFPVQDANGKELAHFIYLIQSLQLQNEIIIKGQKADAVAGRTFLILNLKLTNPTSQSLQINTRDFVRITLDKSADLLAPSIHNDPVSLQPISTEYTRIAIPIDTTVKTVTLHVGEINGQKTDIPVSIVQ